MQQTLQHASQEPQAIPKPQLRQTPPPRASRDWIWSLPASRWGSDLQRHRSSHPKHGPVPIVTPSPSHRPQQAGEQSSSPGDVLLQSLRGLIPEITAPQRQPGKQRRWDARKAALLKGRKPSARIRDLLCCIFSHEKQMLKKKPEYGSTDSWRENLQGRGKSSRSCCSNPQLEKPALKGRQTNEENIRGNCPPTGLQPSHLTLLFVMSGSRAQRCSLLQDGKARQRRCPRAQPSAGSSARLCSCCRNKALWQFFALFSECWGLPALTELRA